MKKTLLCFTLVLAIQSARAADSNKLVVHEWGTFTSLQDEDGNAIAGLNSDDEPVPKFVHRISDQLIAQPPSPQMENMQQGAPRSHPDVTMRLETPVIYFYPPEGLRMGHLDVHVAFKGGWLTEFYPKAAFVAPGFDSGNPGTVAFGHIDRDKNGELSWKGLVLHASGTVPETTEKVWLAPRDVNSSPVTTPEGETEKFLFYRGVGNADASLRIERDAKGDTLEVRDTPRESSVENATEKLRVHGAWLVDVRDDGTCAFKSLGALDYGKKIRATMPASFTDSDYTVENMAALRKEMHGALVKEGLFADEAEALLNTWEVSYFKSSGLRFFYLCPRVDTDDRLPLQISVPADVTRVMMGRIEIVTPAQRAVLRELAAGAFKPNQSSSPATLATYQKLGRFRNALVLNELKRRPSEALYQFVIMNGLWAYRTN